MTNYGAVPKDFDGRAFADRYNLDVTDFYVEGGTLYVNPTSGVPAQPVFDRVPPTTADSKLDGLDLDRRTLAALVVALAALSNGKPVPGWAQAYLDRGASKVLAARG